MYRNLCSEGKVNFVEKGIENAKEPHCLKLSREGIKMASQAEKVTSFEVLRVKKN